MFLSNRRRQRRIVGEPQIKAQPEEVRTIVTVWKSVSFKGYGLDPLDLQPERTSLLVGNQEAHGCHLRRIEWRLARQHPAPERRHKLFQRQPMFSPLARLRRETRLIDRAVKTSIHARGKLVAMPVAINADDEGIGSGQFVARRRRARGGEAAIVRQRNGAVKNGRAVGQAKFTGGHAAHHVVIDDLPGGRVGDGLKIKNKIIRGVGVHSEKN